MVQHLICFKSLKSQVEKASLSHVLRSQGVDFCRKKEKKKKSLLSAFEGSDAAFDVAVSNKVASPRDSAVPLPPSRVPWLLGIIYSSYRKWEADSYSALLTQPGWVYCSLEHGMSAATGTLLLRNGRHSTVRDSGIRWELSWHRWPWAASPGALPTPPAVPRSPFKLSPRVLWCLALPGWGLVLGEDGGVWGCCPAEKCNRYFWGWSSGSGGSNVHLVWVWEGGGMWGAWRSCRLQLMWELCTWGGWEV